MKVLVTGVTGFIGGALVRRLVREGWNVSIVVREESDISGLTDVISYIDKFIYDGSTESLIEILSVSKPELIYHLASLFLSEHLPHDVTKLIQSNVLFGTQLLEAMSVNSVKKIVNAGTSWQYFHSSEYRASNLYAATKQAFEDILSFYSDKNSISQVTLKLFDTYGPDDKRRKLVNLVVNAIKTNVELGVSPGEQIIDISFIDDVVEEFYQCGKYLHLSSDCVSEAYFVSGERFTVKGLVEQIANAYGQQGNIVFGARPYRDREVMTLPEVSGKTSPWSKNRKITPLSLGVLKI